MPTNTLSEAIIPDCPAGQITSSQEQIVAPQKQVMIAQEQLAVPQAVEERRETVTDHRKTKSSPECMPCAECTAMVTYLTPEMEIQKHRSESATLYIDYPTGIYDVRRDFIITARSWRNWTA